MYKNNHDDNVLYVKYRIILYAACHEAISAFVKLKSIWAPIPDSIINRIKKDIDDMT